MILEKATKVLKYPVCDSCLGRQFGRLLHGYTNAERGRLMRTMVAMSIDRTKEENKEHAAAAVDLSNFSGYVFHNLDAEITKNKKSCALCNGLFGDLDTWVRKAEKSLKGRDARTFLVGTKLPFELVEAEETMWENVGIDFCEPIKAEINREVGKRIEKKLKIKFNPKSPDVNIIINLAENKVTLETNPFFIYGEYQKLKRGIPQTKWPSGKYKTSVEQIIAKPFLAVTGAKSHKLHGMGREDIDARCLGWRPFVLELIEPRTRGVNIQKLAKKIAPAVKVRRMRPSGIAEVRKIKEARIDKTYSMVVETSKEIRKDDLKKLLSLREIRQKTPERVIHRRADKTRKRKVKSIKFIPLTKRSFRLVVKCEGGLYVKELVSGDNGRTEPSVAALIGVGCRVRDLDVTKIHVK